ncbi:MAG: tripartite tricarboxylate transporter TctB family protein [Rhodospirillaceae bacterium]|jgi:putative tricarboxylic transport membrane protein|nr:tripartite tricarboxylate transporter TctB family protein [Rhodospirillaceae bacterium]MBT6139526.1 tripartite tricarboxylate transporter TctB family protein [Rhodospirillaceae bacterium]
MQFLIIPGSITAFSVAVIWAALQLDVSPPMVVGDSLQPRVFPIFLMIINIGLAVFLAIQYRKSPPKTNPREALQTWGTMALFVVFYFFTVYLDMMIAIAVVMFAMCLMWGERRIHVAGAVAFVTPVTIFFLFDLVLRVRFPRGLLTNWYYG